jgi:hypothetical protein
MILKCVSPAETIVITPESFTFGDAIRLNEIGEKAFAECTKLSTFTVPSSTEIIGGHCFEKCSGLVEIAFEDFSELKRIGEYAFAKSGLTSITVPASIEEINGSASVACPLETIALAPGSLKFVIAGNMLSTSNGRELVTNLLWHRTRN